MEFIISKGKEGIPKDILGMETTPWFNMWKTRKWPYKELLKGDIIYFLNIDEQRLIWKTKVVDLTRYHYLNKEDLLKEYGKYMSNAYYKSRPVSGYFLRYSIEVLENIDVPKPGNYKFDQLGWEKLDKEKFLNWFNAFPNEDNTTIDENIDSDEKSLLHQLQHLNERMQNVSPERIETLISTSVRKDTKIIKALKEAAGFKCQFPDCRMQIRKENGDFYIEVAHIDAVKNGGKSVLGNLLVLCPNHHKEFDFGEKNIKYQTLTELSGTLNGRDFTIKSTF